MDVRDPSVAYGSQLAVNRLSFEVRCGETFGLLGPNGAEKTSALSAVFADFGIRCFHWEPR